MSLKCNEANFRQKERYFIRQTVLSAHTGRPQRNQRVSENLEDVDVFQLHLAVP